MTLKQLEAFYWICRLGTFAAAAVRLNTTQSSISMRIRQLETHLGVELFDRGARSNRMTPRGEELFAFSQNIFRLVSEIETSIGKPEVVSRTVRLGVGELIVVSWLSDLLTAVNEAYPRLTLNLEVDLTLNQLRKLRAGELDMAMVPEPADMSGLAGVALGTVHFAWMASPKLPIPKGRLTPSELERWPLLTLTQSAHSHGLISQWCERNSIRPKSRNLANSVGVLLTLTLAGLGVSFLPIGPQTTDHIKKGRLRILDMVAAVPPYRFSAVYEKDREDPLLMDLARVAARFSSFTKTRAAKRKS